MRALATACLLLLGPASLAEGRSELDILRARSTEQERQIRALESEIENLHSQLALERRRSRGVELSAAPAPKPSAPAEPLTYTVKTGDTLSSIARRYRTSTEGLMKSNGISDPTRLRVGQRLALPSEAQHPAVTPTPKQDPKKIVKSPAGPPAAAPKKPHPKNYQVQRGDTLYGIARRHQMSIGALRTMNPALEDRIVVGQRIAVDGEPRVSAPDKKRTTNTRLITTPSPSKPANKPRPPAATKKKPVEKKEQATPPVEKKTKTQSPPEEPTPAPSEIVKEEEQQEKVTMPKSVTLAFVTEEVSFGDFAKRHQTTPDQLNALNGWDFKSSLVLAKGSEIYVPSN